MWSHVDELQARQQAKPCAKIGIGGKCEFKLIQKLEKTIVSQLQIKNNEFHNLWN